MEKIDLHMHSTASDGSSTPRELARECKAAGITRAALTDHDTIDGVAEFLERFFGL
ncbi:MAG: PHP domain-containing protein [Clostridiales bacterium]|nr:PHP domain-containing protein [Clostridiales bacterium]